MQKCSDFTILNRFDLFLLGNKNCERTNSFRHIPVEILEEIFTYLSVPDLVQVSKVNKLWSKICEHEKTWKNKKYTVTRYETRREIKNIILNSPELEVIVFKRTLLPCVFKEICTHCRNLISVDIDMHQEMELEMIQALSEKCKFLSHITLPHRFPVCSDSYLDAVGAMKNLKSLSFRVSIGDYMNFEPLARGCDSLERIDVSRIYAQIIGFDKFVSSKKQLKSLRTRCVMCHDVFVLPMLENRRDSMKELCMVDCDASSRDEDFLKLKTFVNLTALTFYGLCDVEPRIMATIFDRGAMSQLTRLEFFTSENLDSSLIRTVCMNCPILNRLSIFEVGESILTEEALDLLSNLRFLRHLQIGYNKFMSVRDALNIGKCSSLQDLKISHFRGQLPLGVLFSGLRDLRFLRLERCDVTLLSELDLSRFNPRLRHIVLSKVNGLHPKKLEKLREGKPYFLEVNDYT